MSGTSFAKVFVIYRRSFLFGAASFVAFGKRSEANTSANVVTLERGVLKIGTYFVNPPFEYRIHNKPAGFEVELMKAVARHLDLRPIFIDTRWEVMLSQQESGRYDCIVGGITITPSREKRLIWSRPYIETTLSIIVNATRTPNIRDLADLKTASVGVQAATTDYDAAAAMRDKGEIGSIEVYPFARISEAMSDLAAGRVTAVMKVAPVAAWLARQSTDLRIVAQVPNDPQLLGIGFRQSSAPLRMAVNDALTAIKSNGQLAALARKWDVP